MSKWFALGVAVVAVSLAGVGYTSWTSGVPVEAARRSAAACANMSTKKAKRDWPKPIW